MRETELTAASDAIRDIARTGRLLIGHMLEFKRLDDRGVETDLESCEGEVSREIVVNETQRFGRLLDEATDQIDQALPLFGDSADRYAYLGIDARSAHEALWVWSKASAMLIIRTTELQEAIADTRRPVRKRMASFETISNRIRDHCPEICRAITTTFLVPLYEMESTSVEASRELRRSMDPQAGAHRQTTEIDRRVAELLPELSKRRRQIVEPLRANAYQVTLNQMHRRVWPERTVTDENVCDHIRKIDDAAFRFGLFITQKDGLVAMRLRD